MNSKKIQLLFQVAELFHFKEVFDNENNAFVVFQKSACRLIDERISDKTRFESLENHVHLLDRIPPKEIPHLIPIAESLGQAVLASLVFTFPDKHFAVYVTLQPRDSMILRFHQVWPGEEPFCYASDFENSSEIVFVFQN